MFEISVIITFDNKFVQRQLRKSPRIWYSVPRKTSFLLDQPVCTKHTGYEKLHLLEGMIISRCTHKNWLQRTLSRRFRRAVLFRDISRQQRYTSRKASIHRATLAQISINEILSIHIPFSNIINFQRGARRCGKSISWTRIKNWQPSLEMRKITGLPEGKKKEAEVNGDSFKAKSTGIRVKRKRRFHYISSHVREASPSRLFDLSRQVSP